jgi:hypothetical protein
MNAMNNVAMGVAMGQPVMGGNYNNQPYLQQGPQGQQYL